VAGVAICLGDLPDEQPGALREIWAADDSRESDLILSEIYKVDGVRRCEEAVGVAVDPCALVDAVSSCISGHLYLLLPEELADRRRVIRVIAQRAEAAAKALEDLSLPMDQRNRAAWLERLKGLGLSDPTDPRVIKELRNVATQLGNMLPRGADGRPRMEAFELLIRDLARTYERATGRQARVTRGPGGYSGKFWDLVEVLRPIAASIIETSGEGVLAQPTTELARGKFIERLTQEKPNRQNPRLKI
jgi:hypothetical protein